MQDTCLTHSTMVPDLMSGFSGLCSENKNRGKIYHGHIIIEVTVLQNRFREMVTYLAKILSR